MKKRVITWIVIAVCSLTLCVVIGCVVRGNQNNVVQEVNKENLKGGSVPEESGLVSIILNNFSGIEAIDVLQSVKSQEGIYQVQAVITTSDGKEENHNFTIRYKTNSYEVVDEKGILQKGFS